MLGGTWSSYPHAYQEEFIRDLFYAYTARTAPHARFWPFLAVSGRFSLRRFRADPVLSFRGVPFSLFISQSEHVPRAGEAAAELAGGGAAHERDGGGQGASR